MSTLSHNQEGLVNSVNQANWRDYYEMCKPTVVLLMLLCSTVGMFLATDGLVSWDVLVYGNLGIALVAGSAAAVNHIVDRQIDIKMARTQKRPVAQGRVQLWQGIMFSLITGLIGLAILALLVNPLTAWLNLGSWFGYAIIYSIYLKRATPQNIVIGGLFGAAPPLFGWTAVTNSIDGHGLLLVLIIFAWTPPHFWALALHRKDEYAKADVPMLPVTHSEEYTRLHILLYTFLLVAASLLPFATGLSGVIYLVGALLLGIGFLYWACLLLKNTDPKAAIQTFKYSIYYLMILFVVLLVDHYIPIGVLSI